MSNIAYMSDRDPVTYFLYFVVNSCGTPLVYYLGIEENRRQAQDYFRTISLSSSVQCLCNRPVPQVLHQGGEAEPRVARPYHQPSSSGQPGGEPQSAK